MSEINPEVPALEPVAEAPVADAPAEAEAPAVQEAPPAVPVLQQTPSNDAADEPVAEVEDAPQSTIAEAAAALLALVDEGHKIGDKLVDKARDELRAILS